jgi:hypothetical protein
MLFITKLKRIVSCLVIAFTVIGSCCYGTTVTFPHDTPGYRREVIAVDDIDVPYENLDGILYMNIPLVNPNYEAKLFTWIHVANTADIFFPVDGSQPTTEQAVKWSCANVQDDAVTEWYMKMFGLQTEELHMGFSNASNSITPDSIITLDNSVGEQKTGICVLGETPATRKDAFIENFRIIASTSVGRVLLYRLLIEIRRQKNGDGCCETKIMDAKSSENRAFRDKARSIIIKWSDYSNRFEPASRTIKFGIHRPHQRMSTVTTESTAYTPAQYASI